MTQNGRPDKLLMPLHTKVVQGHSEHLSALAGAQIANIINLALSHGQRDCAKSTLTF